MLKSLDNFLSRGPNSSFNKSRRERNMEVKSLNENHAREVLELHTLSPAGGYSQTDVIETAKIMSGWGFLRDGKKGERVESRLVGFVPGVNPLTSTPCCRVQLKPDRERRKSRPHL